MSLKHRLEQIQTVIGTQPVTLVAVTKHASLAQMCEAYTLGVRHFGENKVQDALAKKADLPPEIVKNVTWHLIGHLQSNKTNKTVGEFQLIHSVDSLALAQALSEKNQAIQRVQPVLFQVNISQEPTKTGFMAEEMLQAVNTALTFPGIRLQGLMTMTPAQASVATLKQVFCNLKGLRDELVQTCSIELPDLSMGMSQDYVHAIACGATIIRIGSDLFCGN